MCRVFTKMWQGSVFEFKTSTLRFRQIDGLPLSLVRHCLSKLSLQSMRESRVVGFHLYSTKLDVGWVTLKTMLAYPCDGAGIVFK